MTEQQQETFYFLAKGGLVNVRWFSDEFDIPLQFIQEQIEQTKGAALFFEYENDYLISGFGAFWLFRYLENSLNEEIFHIFLGEMMGSENLSDETKDSVMDKLVLLDWLASEKATTGNLKSGLQTAV